MGVENKILVDNNVDDFIKIDLDEKKNEDYIDKLELYNSYKISPTFHQQSQHHQKQQPVSGIPISYNKFFKEKIRKQYAFNMGYPRFDSDLYPVEMSNYLTEREYKSSIDQINQVFNHYRRISNLLHSLLVFEFIGLLIASIIFFSYSLEDEVYSIFGMVILLFLIILSSIIIGFIINLKKKAFKKVHGVKFQLNQVYSDRGVRFEIIRRSYNSCKGYVYYPNYSFPFSQQPQVQLYHLPLRSPLPPPTLQNTQFLINNSNYNNI